MTTRTMKRAGYVLLSIAVLVAGAILYVREHSSRMDSRYLVDFKATELRQGRSPVVRLSGMVFSGFLCVKKVTAEREGSSIVAQVHVFFPHKGRGPYFTYDVVVPEDVNEIRLGKDKALVWKRGLGPVILNPQNDPSKIGSPAPGS